MNRRIALCGATTLVGAEVLRELVRRPDIRSIDVLVPADEALRQDLVERLHAYLGPLPQITLVPCDFGLPRFGMSIAQWDAFARSFDSGIHCAQPDPIGRNLRPALLANRGQLEDWIDLLERNPDARLHVLSSALVGGTRRGLFTEFDLECGQRFHNEWERGMFEAEQLLRESRVASRMALYRPSHVLGRSDTGEGIHPGAAHLLVGSLARAMVLPGDASARLDFVPADYVAAAIVTLACRDATGTFHLAGGWDRSMPVREIASLAAKVRGRSRGPLLLPRALSWPLALFGVPTSEGVASRHRAFAAARDALFQGPVFDTFRADLELAPAGITCPDPGSWLERAMRAAPGRPGKQPVPTLARTPALTSSIPVAVERTSLRDNPVYRQKSFHKIGDVNVAYRSIGEGEPVVFLHGFAGAHAWDGVVERIAPHRRALVVETFGLSDTEGPASADFRLAAQAARVRGLLSALGIPMAHIVGNDSGGVIAQFFAVRWPDCVKSLVLSDCDAHGVWPPTHIKWITAVMRIPGGTAALASLMKIPAIARSRVGFGRMVHDKRVLSSDRLKTYVRTVAGNRQRRQRLKRFFRSFEAADLKGLNQLLGQLAMPTMIVWGGDNAYWSPSWAKTLYDAIPGAIRLELIPFAGLSCHEERPDLFARALTEFLDHVDGTATR